MPALEIGSVIDAHIHLWDPLTTPRQGTTAAKVFSRLPSAVVNGLFPVLAKRADRLFVQTPDYVAQPFLIQDYLRLAQPRSSVASDELGLPDTHFSLLAYVHVEANWVAADNIGYVDETRWVHTHCDQSQHKPAAAYVVHADPRDPNVSVALDAHRTVSSKVAGVRFAGSNHPDTGVKDWVQEPHLYADPAFIRGFAAIAETGWTFDAWVYDHQLEDLAVLAQEYPETTFILDHYGTPVGLVGPISKVAVADTDRIARWRDKLARLAALPNVVAKHSGFGMPVLGHHSNIAPRDFIDMMTPHIAFVTGLFGPDRVMFGSNTPMDLPIADYPTLISTVAIGVRETLGAGAWAKVFRENASRVYGLDERISEEVP